MSDKTKMARRTKKVMVALNDETYRQLERASESIGCTPSTAAWKLIVDGIEAFRASHPAERED